MHSLEELSLERISSPALSDNLVMAIAQATPQLVRLHLSPSVCTDKAAEWLEHLPSLTHLTLEAKHGLSAEALISIAMAHPGLQQLRIPHCTQVQDECLEVLVASAPKLRDLSLTR